MQLKIGLEKWFQVERIEFAKMVGNSGTSKRSGATHPKKSKMGGSRLQPGQPRGRRMSATLLTTGLAAAAAVASSRDNSVASSRESSVEFSADRGVAETSFAQINRHEAMKPVKTLGSGRVGSDGVIDDAEAAATRPNTSFIQRFGKGKLAALAAGAVAVVGAGLDLNIFAHKFEINHARCENRFLSC